MNTLVIDEYGARILREDGAFLWSWLAEDLHTFLRFTAGQPEIGEVRWIYDQRQENAGLRADVKRAEEQFEASEKGRKEDYAKYLREIRDLQLPSVAVERLRADGLRECMPIDSIERGLGFIRVTVR